MLKLMVVALALMLQPGVGHAAHTGVTVQVELRGLVADNFAIFDPFVGAPVGSEAKLSFRLHAHDFVGEHGGDARGYAIDTASFALTLDGKMATLDRATATHQPVYFVIQDNHGGRDSFFLGLDVNRSTGAPLEMASGYQTQACHFQLSLGERVLHSADLLDAVGAYSGTLPLDAKWVVSDGPFDPVTMRFESLRLSIVRRG